MLKVADKIYLGKAKPDTADLTGVVKSSTVTTIVSCTQAEYDALVSAGTVSATTLYGIIPSAS